MLAAEIKTCKEALDAWDNGDTVWSVEMGGLGPGYEQCIHITAFEILRYMLENPFDFEDMQKDENKWASYKEKRDASVNPRIENLGLSGAQHGAACNIAACFIRQGYLEALESVDEGRKILVSKNFPGNAEIPSMEGDRND